MTSTQPPSNVTRETYPMPETEGYVWANDLDFNDLSTAEQLELISYDTLIEDDYYSEYQSVVIGPDGSIYVIGYLFDTEGPSIAILIRYDSDLNRVAVIRKPSYRFFGLDIDSEGNVYTTGELWEYVDIDGDVDIETIQYELIKYDSTLDQLALVALDKSPRSIAIAPDGSVYVTGLIGFITKYDRELVLQKTVPLDNDPWIDSIKVTPDGSVYVIAEKHHFTGEPYISEFISSDAILIKYDSDLVWQCETRKDKPGYNCFIGLAIGSDESIYVTLLYDQQTNVVPSISSIIKYDSNLTEANSVDCSVLDTRFREPRGEPWGRFGYFGPLTISAEGFIYVAAHNFEHRGGMVLFNDDLIPLNVVFFPVHLGIDPQLFNIAINPNGSVYVIGSYWRLDVERDAAIIFK